MESNTENSIEKEIYKIFNKKLNENNFIEEQLYKVIEEKFNDNNIKEKTEPIYKTNNIKEIKLELITDENGFISYTTKNISGLLEGMFIIPENKIQIKIVFDEDENVKLFTAEELELSAYIPIRQDVFVYMNKRQITDKAMTSNAKYALNDKLKIIISGQPNKKIVLKIRYT